MIEKVERRYEGVRAAMAEEELDAGLLPRSASPSDLAHLDLGSLLRHEIERGLGGFVGPGQLEREPPGAGPR